VGVLQAAVLGCIQGLTEFLPVSSSGHLILVSRIFGWPEQSVTFDAALHLATLGAVVVALFPDLRRIGKGIFEKDPIWNRFVKKILLASVPVFAVGLFFEPWIETVFRSPVVVVANLAIWGVVLLVADRTVRSQALGDVRQVNWKQAVGIGAAQALALVPGTSRSGVTISAGLFAGLDRETAARFSFLLGIPAIAAAGASALLKVAEGRVSVEGFPLAVGFVCAFIFGFFSVRWLFTILRKASYRGFAIYRLGVAAVLFLWLFL